MIDLLEIVFEPTTKKNCRQILSARRLLVDESNGNGRKYY